MWYRLAAAAVLVLSAVALGTAQTPETYSRALPPDKGVLDRLNLRTEWVLNLPVATKRDTIALVQTIDDQLFVQTRTGMLLAIDVRTGQVQWSAALGNRTYTNIYPVGANSRFIYVVSVTQLYCFHRYSGVTEFVVELSKPTISGFGGAPVQGPTADESGVYLVLGASPGTGGTQRVTAFNLPRSIAVVDPFRAAGQKPPPGATRPPNPVDELTRRYPVEGAARTLNPDVFEPSRGGGPRGYPAGGTTSTRSPSLAAMPRVSPPYTLQGQPISESLQIVPSLRQPYHLRNDAQQNLQRTPSISTIPPSVASALALTDLRPKGVEPTLRWELGLNTRVQFPVLITPLRVWAVTDTRLVMALSKVDRTVELTAVLQNEIAAAPGQAGTIGYVPLTDGNMVAADLSAGNRSSGVNVLWRVNVGGIMNHPPVVTKDAVFASGDNSGVTRVDRASGDVIWRTDTTADLLLAVNEEFAYIRDRQGRLWVYDVRRATDPAGRRTVPLSGYDFAAFNVPVVNTMSDRLFLAADNGLLVCLRDASPKYARPVRMAPEVIVNLFPKEAPKKDGGMPTPGMPPEAPPEKPKDGKS
jgi:outer membrane protein assembly factor BamB